MAVEVEPSCQYSVKFCCRVTYDSRGAVWQNGVWHGNAYEAKVCNCIPPCGKKLHPMTFIDACWTFTETKQWMLAQWGGGWSVSAVATATFRTAMHSCHTTKWRASRSAHRTILFSLNVPFGVTRLKLLTASFSNSQMNRLIFETWFRCSE